ncbi:MAG: hypothetical protein IT422_05165 [Pirellulaceae bacterium]|nr:hypothetical protein [Pirellulaceae bacterium]
MPTKRCCCGPGLCEKYCIENSGAPCSTVDAARYYEVVFPLYGDTYSEDTCCDKLFTPDDLGGNFYLVNDGLDESCTWVTEEHGGCVGTLEISAGPDAVLTITKGSNALVYTPVTSITYNPLCTAVFEYRADLSDPPEGCEWPSKVCVRPNEYCCPDYAYPDTLEAYFTKAVLGGCTCSTGVGPAKTLTRVPASPASPPAPYLSFPELMGYGAYARWVGTVDVGSCGKKLQLCMECTPYGASPGSTRMFLTITGDSDPICDGDNVGAEEATDSCDPFIFTFVIESASSCCDGEAFATELILHIFDPS